MSSSAMSAARCFWNSMDRVTPTSVGQLEIGAVYQLTGKAKGLDIIPTQVFRLESMNTNPTNGTQVLVGTLWYKFWIAGRWYSGTYKNHQVLSHNVSIGMTTGKHDFHLERIDPNKVKEVLGQGRAYGDYIQQTFIDERQT